MAAEDVPGEIRLAAALLGLQALALGVAGVVFVAKTLGGSADSLGRAASDAAFALGGAALLLVAARALLLLRPAARTPVAVVEFLALPISYSIGTTADRLIYSLPILLSALVVLCLLFSPATRRVLDR